MLIRIDDSNPRPIYQQIVDEVRRGVVLGTLVPDDPLPSLRQLATELEVNPNTVQQAYRELERLGLAYVRRGQGTFVARVERDRALAERATVAVSVAERALRDAHRNGLGVDELIEAIRVAATAATAATPASPPGAATTTAPEPAPDPTAPEAAPPDEAPDQATTAQRTKGGGR